jgi:hypothetical protein
MSKNYIENAINVLAVAQSKTLKYSYIGFCNTEEEFNNIDGKDDFDFTWTDVQTKATELETADTNKETAKTTAQASGNTKLLDLGLTQAEATALTGYTPE